MKNPRNLEELKARSEDFCSGNLGLIKIARIASSPNAAHELAIKKGYFKEQAQACRYLVIIKRDYGTKAFNQVLKEWKQKLSEVIDVSYLSMFAQAAARFHYIYLEKDARLSKHDMPYVRVVRRFLEHFERLDDKKREAILKGRGAYLEQVEFLVELAEAGNFDSIYGYMLEKTPGVLWSFIKALAPESASNFLHGFSFDRIHDLEEHILPEKES